MSNFGTDPEERQDDANLLELILKELRVISIIICEMQDEDRDSLIKDVESK